MRNLGDRDDRKGQYSSHEEKYRAEDLAGASSATTFKGQPTFQRNIVVCSERLAPTRSAFVYYSSLLCLLLMILLRACSAPATPSSDTGPIDSPTSQAHTIAPHVMARGNFREDALPQGDDGLMRPAIDHKGRIWFGEMNRNYLAAFDPRTHKFQQMTPPHSQYGIMGVVVAADNTIWFAEQHTDYIGHYFPATGRYEIYSLPTFTVPDPSNAGKTMSLPNAPNDLALDSQGNIWFT
jgi:virginiamycin B lyase